MADETPLVALENDGLDYRKEVEENLKKYTKISLKTSSNDKSAYTESLEEALKQLDEHKSEADDLISDAGALSKDDEPGLKLKDFQKRQGVEVKKLRETLGKIDKAYKKLKVALDAQKKADEREEARTKTAVTEIIKQPASSSTNNDSQDSSQDNKNGSKEGEDDEDAEDEMKEINDEEEPKEKGLKELMMEEQKKADERKENKKQEVVPNILSKKDKEKLKKEEEKKKKEEEKKKKEEEKKRKEEEKRKKKEEKEKKKGKGKKDEPPVTAAAEDNEVKSDAAYQPEVFHVTDADIKKSKYPELLRIMKELKEIELQEMNSSQDNTQNDSQTSSKSKGSKESDKNGKIEERLKKPKVDEEWDEASEDEAEKKIVKSEHASRSKVPAALLASQLRAQEEQEHDDEGEDNDEENDEDVEASDEIKKIESKAEAIPEEFAPGQRLIVVADCKPEAEGDLEANRKELLEFLEYEDDPQWLEVKNMRGQTGFIPRSKVTVYQSDMELESEEEAEELEAKDNKWKEAKGKLEKKGLLESKALKQSGAVPTSFTDANLPEMLDKYSIKQFLEPQLSSSNLSFKNFFWESKESKLRSKLAQFQKLFCINKCTNIPAPNKADVTVLSRTARVCLFDGVSVQSNIHTIRAHIIGKDEKTWHFENDLSDSVSISDFSEFFVRSNVQTENNNLGLLFELTIYCKINSSGEESELCCGWAHLPFVDASTKQHLANKGYEIILNGGSIFEKNVPLDDSTRRQSGGFNELINKMFKESKMKLNVKEPSNVFFETLNCLPEPLVGSTITAPFIKYHRETLAMEFLAPLIELGSFDMRTEPIQSPFLSTFANSLDNPDILDAARFNFILARENMKRDDKNDNNKLRKAFIRSYMEVCYPLLYHAGMPEFDLSNADDLEIRSTIISKAGKAAKKQKLLPLLLSGEEKFKPFSIDELKYEILA